jgi:hypothetical protein
MQAYQYQPLDADLEEIRLIELMPGSFEENLRVRIYNVQLLPPVIKRQIAGYTFRSLKGVYRTIRSFEQRSTIDICSVRVRTSLVSLVSSLSSPPPDLIDVLYCAISLS